MLYFRLEDFCKVSNTNDKMYVFDFDGTLCAAKYCEKGINDIKLTASDLKQRDENNSPYVNGTVRLSLISKWLQKSDINSFIVCTGCFGSYETALAKQQWISMHYPEKNCLFITTFSSVDKLPYLLEIEKVFNNAIYVDDSLECLLGLEAEGCKCKLIHTSTFEIEEIEKDT